MTFVQWFMLSMSDEIVMQSLQTNIDVISPYHEPSPSTAALDSEYAKWARTGPISAFSRYAAIYGLRKDSMRYGLGCGSVNKTALSWQTQGNWICDPKFFH